MSLAAQVDAPVDLEDVLALADWLEVLALQADGLPASVADVDQVLRQAGGASDDETIDLRTHEVAAELDERGIAAGDGYPFDFDGRLLSRRSDAETHVPYRFCLCLSYLVGQGWDRQLDALVGDQYPRRDFEHLARAAAAEYLGGERARSLRFGSPRDELPATFDQALAALVKALGEGDGCTPDAAGQSPGTGDTSLDVVAWRPFLDSQRSKLVLFGQCATGRGWERKLTELSPAAFCQDYIVGYRQPWPVKGFFVPHRLTARQWRLCPTQSGIVFDRCRIAALEPSLGPALRERLVRWTTAAIEAMAEQP